MIIETDILKNKELYEVLNKLHFNETNIIYLTTTMIINIHQDLTEMFGGTNLVLNYKKLNKIVDETFERNNSSIVEAASFMFYKLANEKIFESGNASCALMCLREMLNMNDIDFTMNSMEQYLLASDIVKNAGFNSVLDKIQEHVSFKDKNKEKTQELIKAKFNQKNLKDNVLPPILDINEHLNTKEIIQNTDYPELKPILYDNDSKDDIESSFTEETTLDLEPIL